MELKDLKEGDKVIVYGRWNDCIKVIEKVTKTHIIVNGIKYRREDGRKIGGSVWNGSHIDVCTEEEENRIRTQYAEEMMKRYIKDYNIESLNFKKLEQIYNILKDQNENG